MTEIEPEPAIAAILDEIQDRRKMGEGIRALMSRQGEFSSAYEMRLAGAAMVPAGRDALNDALTEMFASTDRNKLDNSDRELVIGAGYSAAVYCAVRAAMGKPKPIVIDRSDPAYIGGTFALSPNPVFRLNSGNRPGKGGIPGDQGASLNFIPGAVIQPSMLSSEYYQTNADMALAIRLALAQFALVVPGVTATGVDGTTVTLDQGGEFSRTFRRVLDARGLGDPISPGNGTAILDFPQFVRKMGEPFPLRGLRNVAVIGGGDSGKCAVESLAGIAPGSMGPAGLDYVQRIDWYDRNLPTTKEDWKATQRGRYSGICQLIDKRAFITQRSATALPSLSGALVGGVEYDLVVQCTGNRRTDFGGGDLDSSDEGDCLKSYSSEFYVIGAGSNLPFTTNERDKGFARISANQVAMFRYGPRIASLASRID